MRPLAALAIFGVLGAACGFGAPSADEVAAAPTALPTAPPTAPPTTPPPAPTADPAPDPTSPASAPPATATTALVPPEVPFSSEIRTIDAATAERMAGSWRDSCPVPLSDLRLVLVSHWGYDGDPRIGEIVVHADVAPQIVAVFERLFEARFLIERMQLVDEYGGDDDASMAANNTSAFNCRSATGSDRWSEHAYGRAVDINPLVNPYVSGSYVAPPGGSDHLDRSATTPGLIRATDVVVAAFADIGWSWGGDYASIKDYQHFSSTGR